MLIVLAGLPGVGKTSIARALSRQLGAVHIRIDTIEQALLRSNVLGDEVSGAGYSVGYAVAEENLRAGLTVIADSVNPLAITRDSWLGVAARAAVRVAEIEVVCSDRLEHRRRVETRTADLIGHRQPTWSEVVERDYEVWPREHKVIDTALDTVEAHTARLITELKLCR